MYLVFSRLSLPMSSGTEEKSFPVGFHWLIYRMGCTHSQCHVSPVLGNWSKASEGLDATSACPGLFGRLLGETFECCPFECDLLFFWRTLESRFVLGNRKKERAVLDPSSASLQAAYLQREEAHLGDPSSEEHTGCHMPSVSQISYQWNDAI